MRDYGQCCILSKLSCFPILLASKLGEGGGDVLLGEAVEGSLLLDTALCWS